MATPDRVAELIEATRVYSGGGHDGVLDRRGEVYGGRDLLWRIDEVRRLAKLAPLTEIAGAILGSGAFAVRGLFFDKTPTANWNLPWHQDLTIAVRERRDTPGFGPWTLKGGIVHVRAPEALLCAHGDNPAASRRLRTGERTDAGAARLSCLGEVGSGMIATWSSRSGTQAVDCLVPAGGAVVMRPLLLHASASGTGPGHRRVIHLEYAAEALPGGLEWYEVEAECEAAEIAR